MAVDFLIAVKSCQMAMNRGDHESIRSTWGQHFSNLRFFVGGLERPERLLPDEIWLPVEDEYLDLPKKVRKMLIWSSLQGYPYTFLCDNDTFINPNDSWRDGILGHDYIGSPIDQFGCVYANGGPGYFASHHLATKVIESNASVHHAEDLFVGIVAQTYAIPLHTIGAGTFHFPAQSYGEKYHPDFQWQEQMYKRYVEHGNTVLVRPRKDNACGRPGICVRKCCTMWVPVEQATGQYYAPVLFKQGEKVRYLEPTGSEKVKIQMLCNKKPLGVPRLETIARARHYIGTGMARLAEKSPWFGDSDETTDCC